MCLIVALLPLMIILITASLFSKMYNRTSHWEELVFVQQVFLRFLEFNSSITSSHRSRVGIRSIRKVVSNEITSDCGAVRHWRLLLEHPTYWNECSISKDTSYSPWCWLRVFQTVSKVIDLEQTQSTMLSRVYHMTIFVKIHSCDAHPTDGNECWTSKDTPYSLWYWFRFFNVSCKVCVLLYFITHTIIHWCDECFKSNEPSVSHKLLSILWLLVPVC